ncbi:anti-sigma factor [Amorphus orientalis]|uniref:Anti-sigma-K factor RskA n=1 Tax=Amorphus orientalis TaxID=649198 RepID=A0AAE3VP76_9HYPH|nr:anti-sigma factor [Amorphus orientalis]MDQ0315698.1 anti-sigma-K factor RskA [Amorphus orientalis]
MTRPVEELADEFVLGLLDAQEAKDVEHRMDRDPALAQAVATARDRYLALDLAAEPVDLPSGFADRVDAALGAGEDNAPEAPADVPPAANENKPAPRRRWRMAAAAAVVAFVVGLGLGREVFVQEPVVIAVLLDETGTPTAVVEDFGNDTAEIRFLADVQVPAGRVMEVWTLPSQERGPVSLGLVDAARQARLRGPELPSPSDNQLYEITLEQAGGSPTGRPTGPIIAKGFAAPQI